MRETSATGKASAGTARAADGSASERRGSEPDEADLDGVAVADEAVAGDSAGGAGEDDPDLTDSTDDVATDAAPTADSSEPTATEPTDPVAEAGSSDTDDTLADSGSVAADIDTTDGFRMPAWAGGRAGRDSLVRSVDSGAPADQEPEHVPLRPPYTRPPGMVPPPGGLSDNTAERTIVSRPNSLSAAANSPSGAFATLSAAPVSAPPRVTGRGTLGGMTVRPMGMDGSAGPRESTTGTARFGEPMRPRPAATPRGPRRARLNLKRVDPWSVMKFSFAVSLVMFIVVIVAASVLYLALDAMGVFASINSTVAELVSSGGAEGSETFRITARGVIGTAAVLGALNVLLFTSLATLGAFIYNVCADLVGGVEVTLAERD